MDILFLYICCGITGIASFYPNLCTYDVIGCIYLGLLLQTSYRKFVLCKVYVKEAVKMEHQLLDYPSIGHKFKSLRQAQGITQEELARRCNISASYLSHIEAGNKIFLWKPFLLFAGNYLSVVILFYLTNYQKMKLPVKNY